MLLNAAVKITQSYILGNVISDKMFIVKCTCVLKKCWSVFKDPTKGELMENDQDALEVRTNIE